MCVFLSGLSGYLPDNVLLPVCPTVLSVCVLCVNVRVCASVCLDQMFVTDQISYRIVSVSVVEFEKQT